MRICKECGEKMYGTNEICAVCGAKMDKEFDNEKSQTRKKNKGRKNFGKKNFWFILIAILLIIFCDKAYKVWNVLYGENDVKNENIIVDRYTDFVGEYEEKLKQEESDIEGMTKYDKAKMGLNPEHESDTDGDGITDKDEIEKYQSNPLEKSTAGDLYEDGYKIDHNMDLFTKYEYKEDINFVWNECEEIEFTATCVDDFYAVAENITGSERLSGYEILAEYRIYNYGGNLSIDVSSAVANTKYKVSELAVLINEYGTKGVEECTYTQNEYRLTLDKQFNNKKIYKVYIVPKKMASRFTNIFKELNPFSSYTVSSGSGLVYGSKLLSLFGKPNVTIIVEDIGEFTNLEKQALIDEVNEKFTWSFSKKITDLDDESIKIKSKKEIEGCYSVFQSWSYVKI